MEGGKAPLSVLRARISAFRAPIIGLFLTLNRFCTTTEYQAALSPERQWIKAKGKVLGCGVRAIHLLARLSDELAHQTLFCHSVISTEPVSHVLVVHKVLVRIPILAALSGTERKLTMCGLRRCLIVSA